MKSLRTYCSTLLLTAAALVCVDSVAAEMIMKQRVVNYSDLNLNNAAGVKVLYGRIRNASRSVCGRSNEVLPVLRAAQRECVTNALEDAIRQVNNANLTAYHLQKTAKDAGEKLASRP